MEKYLGEGVRLEVIASVAIKQTFAALTALAQSQGEGKGDTVHAEFGASSGLAQQLTDAQSQIAALKAEAEVLRNGEYDESWVQQCMENDSLESQLSALKVELEIMQGEFSRMSKAHDEQERLRMTAVSELANSDGLIATQQRDICQLRSELEQARAEKFNMPEGCKLAAVHTGDGWELDVRDSDGECLGILAWPKQWPEEMSSETLTKYGFEII
jgi:chromosome segregation ATPase